MESIFRDRIDVYAVLRTNKDHWNKQEIQSVESVHLTPDTASKYAKHLQDRETSDNVIYTIINVELKN
jgi:hypothetical protein